MATEPTGSVQVLPAGSRIRRLNPTERSRRDALPMRANDGVYSIEEAIALLRRLPEHSLEQVKLIMRVVKASLESSGVQLPRIIEDAMRRQGDLEDNIDRLEAEIAGLAGEILERQTETARLEADLAETTKVRDRLEMAERRGR